MNTYEDLQRLCVKSYFAPSFQEAMEQARLEMGQDALLLNSRETLPEAQHLGAVEVVFGSPAEAAEPAPPACDLQQNLQEIRSLLTRLVNSQSPFGHRRYGAIEQTLIESGVEPALALDIERAAREKLAKRAVVEIGKGRTASDRSVNELLEEAANEVASRFTVDATLGRVTAFVGPPGCGKTTTLVKLALNEGLTAGRAVRLISADNQKIGAREELRRYAAILGVPFQGAGNAEALAQAVESAPPNELLLVDTAGMGAALQETAGADLANLFTRCQDFDVHLVLTASMRPADMARTADRFAAFRPSKVLFTRIDETDTLAPVFCELVRQNRPLSFLANGQIIPDDIAPGSKERIAGSLVDRLPEVLQLVA